MVNQKEKPAVASGRANKITCPNHINNILHGKAKNGWFLRVTTLHPERDPEVFYIKNKPARSLLCLSRHSEGLTRAEALSQYKILCLTQHVKELNDEYPLYIQTEEIAPNYYARYHLITPVQIDFFNLSGVSS